MKTVVFLHGFGCSPTIFNYLKNCLPKHKGILIAYDSNQAIESSYIEILEQLPSTPFYLIGHSLGGVLGHLISTRNPERVMKFISISSPFAGSGTALAIKYIFPDLKILKDLSPGSKPLKEIARSEAKNHLAIISTAGHMPMIVGKNDGVVSVKSQERVNTDNKLFIDANHFEIVQHSKAVDAIKETIFSN